VQKVFSKTKQLHPNPKGSLDDFHHISLSTLSHLLALTLHPPPDLIASVTGLIVIDGLNQLVDLDYPRNPITNGSKTEPQKWQAGRRYAILGSLVSALNKLAVLHNLAVIVTNGSAMRTRAESGLSAALVPGIGGVEWDAGIRNRIVVFRDFDARFVGLQKCHGRSLIPRDEVGEPGHIITFDITPSGTVEERTAARTAEIGSSQTKKLRSSPVKPRKRNIDEIADSDGEDVDEFGWADADDEAFAAGGMINETTTDAVDAKED
jgi:hypothetical protein